METRGIIKKNLHIGQVNMIVGYYSKLVEGNNDKEWELALSKRMEVIKT